MLTGHLIADMVYGPVKILYPLSEQNINLPKVDIEATDLFTSQIIGPMGIGMTLYAAIIFAGAMVHDTLYYRNMKGLKTRNALKTAVKDFF